MDERIWYDRPLEVGATLACHDCVIARIAVPHVSLVSGSLGTAIEALCPGAPVLTLAESPASGDYMIRIARDHAVLVSRAAPARAPGWQAEGFAFSVADDKFAALSLRGPGAEAVLSHALGFALPKGSASCALRVARRMALVTGLPDGLTLWVERADLTYISRFFSDLQHA